jgi:hypothetical protein
MSCPYIRLNKRTVSELDVWLNERCKNTDMKNFQYADKLFNNLLETIYFANINGKYVGVLDETNRKAFYKFCFDNTSRNNSHI